MGSEASPGERLALYRENGAKMVVAVLSDTVVSIDGVDWHTVRVRLVEMLRTSI